MEETISMKLENRFYLEAVDNGPNGYPLETKLEYI